MEIKHVRSCLLELIQKYGALHPAPGFVAVSYESFYCIPNESQIKESIGEGILHKTASFFTASIGLEVPSFSREKF